MRPVSTTARKPLGEMSSAWGQERAGRGVDEQLHGAVLLRRGEDPLDVVLIPHAARLDVDDVPGERARLLQRLQAASHDRDMHARRGEREGDRAAEAAAAAGDQGTVMRRLQAQEISR